MREGGERELEPPVVLVPVQFSEFAPIAIGTAIWALLFVVGLFLRPTLADDGRGWWVWSAAAGVGLGLIGYLYLRRRQARLLARASSRAQPVTESAAEPKTPDQS
ncbi:MAG TPA: DUF2530 domain-containing protein [Kineosporiaceae bacterium]|nr:DUF2530 domain-containing protein [Kineosporiaceae bacterium]